MGEGFLALFSPLAALLLKKDFEDLIDVFPLKEKSRMQEKPSTTFLCLFFIFLFFINQFSLFFSAIL